VSFSVIGAAAICADVGAISGNRVPNAPIQAKNLDTKETCKATSASDGS
jgi:hypothetical protein